MNDKRYFLKLPSPNRIQMLSAVKGDDRYTRKSPWELAIGITLIVAAMYAAFLFYWS